MAGSQLKQLKANLHAKRTASNPKTEGQRGSAPQANNQQKRPNKIASRRKDDSRTRADSLRRSTLLPAIQNRHKIGGIVDRRIGENDPTMSPEERMLQRYAKQRSKRDTFNLEEEDDDEEGLTHGGRSLFDGMADDLDGADGAEADDDVKDELLVKKRKRSPSEDVDPEDVSAEAQSERKRSKKEVMEEVIAKSKMHKYERQKAKDEDDDIREELDKGVGDLLAALRGFKRPAPLPESTKPASMEIHPDRLAAMKGTAQPARPTEPPSVKTKESSPPPANGEVKSASIEPPSKDTRASPPPPLNRKEKAEKEYDQRLRQMAMDQRAQPSERTKTAEERAEEEARRLKELEAKRILRMRGQAADSESEEDEDASDEEGADNQDFEVNEASEFGFKNASPPPPSAADVDKPPDFEDEDDFLIDEDLVASGSEIDSVVSSEGEESDAQQQDQDEEDAEFLKDVLPISADGGPSTQTSITTAASNLPFTYPCPQTHDELLKVLAPIPITDTVLVVQRIRALYHPQLAAANKDKLSAFACTLIDHLAHLGNVQSDAPLEVMEQLIRHIHSLSKSYPDTTADRFRAHMSRMYRDNSMDAGDILILTAIGNIYPTSDHFHQVVTPAITLMCRWLGLTASRALEDQQSQPSRSNPASKPKSTSKPTLTPSDLHIGATLTALVLSYQSYSKRYIPEAVLFTTCALQQSIHYLATQPSSASPHITNLIQMADLWSDKSAALDIFYPTAFKALKRVARCLSESSSAAPDLPKTASKAQQHLLILLTQAKLNRRYLSLHTHRPLAIPSKFPKFEENFNPNRHYDPNAERSEANKLRKEYKRERKGAVRELKRDAEFVSRERYREKRVRDEEVARKERSLIAGIQAEEGRGANEYEREKRKRKGQR